MSTVAHEKVVAQYRHMDTVVTGNYSLSIPDGLNRVRFTCATTNCDANWGSLSGVFTGAVNRVKHDGTSDYVHRSAVGGYTSIAGIGSGSLMLSGWMAREGTNNAYGGWEGFFTAGNPLTYFGSDYYMLQGRFWLPGSTALSFNITNGNIDLYAVAD